MRNEHEACTAEIKLKLPPTLRDKIEHRAAAEGRSLSNMTRRILERALVSERDEAAA
jgi:plasmid stability protein